MSITDALAPFAGRDLIPLPELGNSLGFNKAAQSYAVRHGVITPAPKKGKSGRYMVTRDEAMLIIAAAGLALAIGVALVTAIRALRESGATVTAGGIVIPIAGA